MYYETKPGDAEMHRLNKKLIDEDERSDDEEEELKGKTRRKRRRNEASMLEQENAIDRLSNTRPKRAAGMRKSSWFLSKFLQTTFSCSC